MNKQITINVFADPMMGMHWEMYPSLRKLESRLNDQVKLNFIPIELVKNVYDLVDQRILQQYGKTVALNQYWAKLMEIYQEEEQIGGMPVIMGANDLHLFDQKHPNSKNLDLAYLAVSDLKPAAKNAFLYQLQFATVIEDQQTTDLNTLANLAAEFGIDKAEFKNLAQSKKLAAQLAQFQNLAAQLKIKQLPAFSIAYQGQVYVVKGIVDYANWLKILKQITGSDLKEDKPDLTAASLKEVLHKYPLISEVELKAIFNLQDMTALDKLMASLEQENKVEVVVHKGRRFFKKAGSSNANQSDA